jgi:hypothetical protein
MEQTIMTLELVQKMRVCAAVFGGGAMIALTGMAVVYTQDVDVTAAGSSSGAAPATSTPPTAPAIEKAVPSITGPAPLYAGEAPDSNPQAAMP